MLKSELTEKGTRIRHYSDEGFYIKQIETNILYEDAVDNIPCKYTYEETDELIPVFENPEEELALTEYASANSYPSSFTYDYIEE